MLLTALCMSLGIAAETFIELPPLLSFLYRILLFR